MTFTFSDVAQYCPRHYAVSQLQWRSHNVRHRCPHGNLARSFNGIGIATTPDCATQIRLIVALIPWIVQRVSASEKGIHRRVVFIRHLRV